MKGRTYGLFAFILVFLLLPGKQNINPQISREGTGTPMSVAVYELDNTGIDESTAVVVSDLLFSFMREQRNYTINLMGKTKEEAVSSGTVASETAGYDFILSGKLSPDTEGIRLELLLTGGSPATERFLSRTYENQNKLMLGTRLLVRELFDSTGVLSGTSVSGKEETAGTATASQKPEEDGQKPENGIHNTYEDIPLHNIQSLDSLTGSWNGETGIEKIMILRGGRGAAVFSSGFSLMINMSIQNGELIVVQKGKSSPLQFIDLPDPVAEKAAEQAPPLQWRFRISGDGKILAGEKDSVQITHDGQTILSMEPKTEKVAWIRN